MDAIVGSRKGIHGKVDSDKDFLGFHGWPQLGY